MDPNAFGQKIDRSRYVHQVVDWIYQGMSISKISKELESQFGFSVSLPSLLAFKNNYYQKRLKERLSSIEEMQKKQVTRVRTFIDEAHQQIKDMQDAAEHVHDYIKQLEIISSFSTKFSTLYASGVDKFIETYDPKNPKNFLDTITTAQTEEEKVLVDISTHLQANGSTLAAYITSHTPYEAVKSLSVLHKQYLGYKTAIEKMYKDIFQSYRNYSILQEIYIIFTKLNSLIVEEFYPTEESREQDRERFERVRNRIMCLYTDFQVRYQGYEPSVENTNNSNNNKADVSASAGTNAAPAPEECTSKRKNARSRKRIDNINSAEDADVVEISTSDINKIVSDTGIDNPEKMQALKSDPIFKDVEKFDLNQAKELFDKADADQGIHIDNDNKMDIKDMLNLPRGEDLII